METIQMPLALVGVKKASHIKKRPTNLNYNPTEQITKGLWLSDSSSATVSDVATTSGIFANYDDEERGVDD